MIGWDFSVFWEIGRAVLEGRGPYSVEFSRYPPAAALFFALFGLLPFLASYAAWSGIGVVVYVAELRRRGLRRSILGWLLYTPFLFNLLTGQLDIFFFWLAGFLAPAQTDADLSTRRRTWRSLWLPALAGALLTLKPQLAAVILPWHLLRWLRDDRRRLAGWVALSAVLHALPLLLDTGIYAQWLAALSGVGEMKMGVSSGLFVFQAWNIPLPVLVVAGLALAIWGLTRDEQTSRPAQLGAFPLTIWYDDVLLAGNGPALWLVPLSWAAFIGSYLVQNSLPLALIPAGTLVFRWIERRKVH
jgi:hypothetical protein